MEDRLGGSSSRPAAERAEVNGLGLLLLMQRARDAAFSWIASSGFASFGARSRILLPFRVGNADRIAIGSDVLIGPWLVADRAAAR